MLALFLSLKKLEICQTNVYYLIFDNLHKARLHILCTFPPNFELLSSKMNFVSKKLQKLAFSYCNYSRYVLKYFHILIKEKDNEKIINSVYFVGIGNQPCGL